MNQPPPIAWYVELADPFFRIGIIYWWMWFFLMSKVNKSFTLEMMTFSLLYLFSNGLKGLPQEIANRAALQVLFQILLWILVCLYIFVTQDKSVDWLVCTLEFPICFRDVK